MTPTAGVFCLVPVRSGSKRLRGKNLRRVGGRTLLERAVGVGLEAFGAVTVSTDDPAYAEHALACGATVPGLRPAELATDDASTSEVVHHAVRRWCPAGADVVAVVQASTPFTTAADAAAVVDALRAAGSASAMTVTAVPPATAFVLDVGDPADARFLVPDLATRRTQSVPPLAIPTGGVYAAPIERMRAGEPLVRAPIAVVPVPPERAVDIDDEDDLTAARRIARRLRA